MNVMRQTACLVVNPITVNNFADLFNCTPVGRASDLMMAPAYSFKFSWLGPDALSLAVPTVCVCVYSGLTSLSTIFQSYHDGVWLRQGAQCSLL